MERLDVSNDRLRGRASSRGLAIFVEVVEAVGRCEINPISSHSGTNDVVRDSQSASDARGAKSNCPGIWHAGRLGIRRRQFKVRQSLRGVRIEWDTLSDRKNALLGAPDQII